MAVGNGGAVGVIVPPPPPPNILPTQNIKEFKNNNI